MTKPEYEMGMSTNPGRVQDLSTWVTTALRPSEATLIETAVIDCGIKTVHEAQLAYGAFLQWFLAIPACRGDQKLVMLKGSVDRMWHAFILHTFVYRSLCDRFLGFFLEHQPQAGAPPSASVRETVAFLARIYGVNLSPLLASWSPTALSEVLSHECNGSSPRREAVVRPAVVPFMPVRESIN
jgi:hypothetical protein